MVDMMCGMPLQQRRAREQGSVGEGVQAAGGRRRLFSSIQNETTVSNSGLCATVKTLTY